GQNQMVKQINNCITYPSTLLTDVHGIKRGFPLYMLDSFIESVKKDKESLVTVEEGYEVTSTIDAVHRSIKSGKEELI
ncbi:MAG: Gfo/Idh/MocA family oxidoreductase, partial [Candidatus Hodarchaeota archaeon]